MLELGEIEISDSVSKDDFADLQSSLNRYSIFIVNNESQLIQKNKRYNCRNDL
jgi:hypothetical protein